MPAASGVIRGCGQRSPGGLYLELGLASEGLPVESFLFDPIISANLQVLGMSERGMMPTQDGEAMNLIDYVGETHYPHAADFLEEVRRKGLSRRISAQLPLEELTAGLSKIFMVHPRAYHPKYEVVRRAVNYYNNHTTPGEYRESERSVADGCNGQKEVEENRGKKHGHCSGYLWAFPPGYVTIEENFEAPLYRKFTDFEYPLVMTVLNAKGQSPTDLQAGFFAAFPITNLAVVETPDGSHEQKLEMLDKRGVTVPVSVVEP